MSFRTLLRETFEPWQLPWVQALTAVGCLIAFVLGGGVLLEEAHRPARRVQRLSCLKQFGWALALYAEDYDQTLPPASGWQDDLRPYLRYEYVFSNAENRRRPKEKPLAYALNANLAEGRLDKLANPPRTVLVLEVEAAGPNALARRGQEFQQDGRILVCLADGSIKSLSPSEFAVLDWNSKPQP